MKRTHILAQFNLEAKTLKILNKFPYCGNMSESARVSRGGITPIIGGEAASSIYLCYNTSPCNRYWCRAATGRAENQGNQYSHKQNTFGVFSKLNWSQLWFCLHSKGIWSSINIRNCVMEKWYLLPFLQKKLSQFNSFIIVRKTLDTSICNYLSIKVFFLKIRKNLLRIEL